ncbi:hypothetical protein GM418_12615 [Maribellus comscasis]|uniref:Uncharacterized protein n=1 Tax=Maribellus comscasis TaxID=2681766 RepID=A0A6I6JTP5_9BACT|nr:hypothetical protein [Maribellus comscasis]QGY44470.1 hypothetical protein GM418_12615 [Maribellus comscasis]
MYEEELVKLANKYKKEILGITNPEIENEIISQIPMEIQLTQIWKAKEEYKKDFLKNRKGWKPTKKGIFQEFTQL